MNNRLYIHTQFGLGDNIFCRPFVRAATQRHTVTLCTPWPELYEDLPVTFAKPVTRLRTQAKNVLKQPASRWTALPFMPSKKFAYGNAQLRRLGSLTKAMESIQPLYGAPFVFDLPFMGTSPIDTDRPIAFIRPVTVRKEWANAARNPLPEYVNAVARALIPTHHVVVVADLQDKEEWIVGEMPPHHATYLRGELPIRYLLALIRDSDVVVGGIGWIVPATIALHTKAFIIMGGHGAINAPSIITDPRMDLSNIYFAMPKEFCRCDKMQHQCNKTIPDLAAQWNNFARVIPSLANSLMNA